MLTVTSCFFRVVSLATRSFGPKLRALGYDSLDRLREYQRGTLAEDSTTGVVSVSSSITLPNANVRQTYDLDGLGNWRRTGIAPVDATAATQVRQHNALNQVTKFGDTAVLYAIAGKLHAAA